MFYFFGARAAGTGPRTIVAVMGLPDFRIGSVISRGGRFSRDFRVVRGRPARKRLRRAAGCRFRAAGPCGGCRVPGPSHSRSMGPGRRTARAVALLKNLARNLESLRLRRPRDSREYISGSFLQFGAPVVPVANSTSLRAMANLVRAPTPALHERTLTCQRYAGVCGHLRIGDRGNAIVRRWRWRCR